MKNQVEQIGRELAECVTNGLPEEMAASMLEMVRSEQKFNEAGEPCSSARDMARSGVRAMRKILQSDRTPEDKLSAALSAGNFVYQHLAHSVNAGQTLQMTSEGIEVVNTDP